MEWIHALYANCTCIYMHSMQVDLNGGQVWTGNFENHEVHTSEVSRKSWWYTGRDDGEGGGGSDQFWQTLDTKVCTETGKTIVFTLKQDMHIWFKTTVIRVTQVCNSCCCYSALPVGKSPHQPLLDWSSWKQPLSTCLPWGSTSRLCWGRPSRRGPQWQRGSPLGRQAPRPLDTHASAGQTAMCWSEDRICKRRKETRTQWGLGV